MKYEVEPDREAVGNILGHLRQRVRKCETAEELHTELSKMAKMVGMMEGDRIEDYLNLVGAGELKNFDDIDKMLTGKYKEDV